MKVQTILQSENQECGLACLAMIATSYGHNIGLAELRRKLPPSVRGVNLAQLISHAQHIGFSARAIRLELDELEKLQVPCIIHWDLNHYIVLEKVSGRKIIIHDPARGKRKMTVQEASPHFTGVALELSPNSSFKKVKKAPRVKLRELTGKMVGLKTALFSILMMAIGLEIVGLLMPQVTQWVVDGALVSSDKDLLLVAVLGGGVLVLVEFLIRMARGWMMLRLNQQLAIQWAANLFHHLMRLPWLFFDKRSLGDISTRFQSLEAIRKTLSEGAISGLMDGTVTLLTLGMMLLYSPMLTGIVVMAVLLYLVTRLAFYRPLRDASEERIVLFARENSYFLESIRAVVPIKNYAMTAWRVSNWRNLMADTQNRDVRTERLKMVFSSVNMLIFGIEAMALLYMGGVQVLNRELSLGMLLAFIAYKSQFTQRASSFIDLMIDIRMLGMHAERIAEIALEEPENRDFGQTRRELNKLAGDIEFSNVCFRYSENDPWILKDFSLTINDGESVAIVGPSGCGKTTVLKLLAGMLKPVSGDVYIGGVNIRTLHIEDIRQMTAVIMQDDQLLAGTLAQNITCFEPEVDWNRLVDAATRACIHDTIAAMAMGYDTLVSELGGSVSGGQRQRILLARLLYRAPKIIVLDEATSHLDLENELHVVQALRSVQATRVSIAHRPQTIALSERIVQIDQGKAVELLR
ncbi:MAG: peptidase domain-containing ABC transporter [Lautropia sp.]|nr:peptidase domain-containing ABC transporter [Lautropia sp.]